jgi:predicted aconitase
MASWKTVGKTTLCFERTVFKVLLTDEEQRMLEGEYGSGTQMAMSLLKKFGEAFDAQKMVKADLVHLGINVPTDLLEQMTEGVRHVRAESSLHAVFDPKDWRQRFGISGKKGERLAGIATFDEEEFSRRLRIFKRLGFLFTFTCVPYAVGIVPRQGDVFVATGSSGQIAANSIFAARAARESVSTSFATAITGVTPYMGLLKKENRYAEVLIKVEDLDFDKFNNADYGALGYFIGEVSGTRNVVIAGLPRTLSLEQCKFLTTPLPVSGATTMCHIVGVTPEAPTLEAALGGKRPKEEVKIGKKEIEAAYGKLNNASNRNVDLVLIGCPHCLISELRGIASLLEGKKIKEGPRLLVATSNSTYAVAKDAGYADIIEKAGAIVSNCCASIVNPLLFLDGVHVVATNSSKGAHYIQRMSGGRMKTYFGDVKTCINSAITGEWR